MDFKNVPANIGMLDNVSPSMKYVNVVDGVSSDALVSISGDAYYVDFGEFVVACVNVYPRITVGITIPYSEIVAASFNIPGLKVGQGASYKENVAVYASTASANNTFVKLSTSIVNQATGVNCQIAVNPVENKKISNVSHMFVFVFEKK